MRTKDGLPALFKVRDHIVPGEKICKKARPLTLTVFDLACAMLLNFLS